MMGTNRLRVDESSQVGEVRRLAASMGRELEFDGVGVEHVSIVATELATNLVKHAGGGELLLRALRTPDTFGIELLALDRGPGIANIGESLGDGYSTAKSRGNGLGAIQRLSSLFDIYSKPGLGTAVLSMILKRTPSRGTPAHAIEIGAVCVAVAREEVCGDAWEVHQSPGRALITIADGLGHGEFAAEASDAAMTVFKKYPECGPKEMLERMHGAMRSTRGAAVAVVEIVWDTRVIRYAGVGNIAGRIVSADDMRSMVSHNGTVGMEVRKIDEFVYAWPENGLLVMNSDGITAHWDLGTYPGLRGRHASLVAGVLFRDFSRERDDRTVVVMREMRSA